MTNQAPDPEFLEILAKVARSSGSPLLQVTPRQRRQQPFERVRIGHLPTGWTAAERELASVHRVELARLLHEAFWLGFDDAYEGGAVVVDRSFEPTEPHEWEHSAADALEALPARSELLPARRILRRALERGRDELPPLTDLLLVALRLDDNEYVRNDLAVGMIQEGRLVDAERVLGLLSTAAVPCSVEWLVWLNLGWVASLRNQFAEASDCYARSASFPSSSMLVRVAAFASALMTDDSRTAASILPRLDQQGSLIDGDTRRLLSSLQSFSANPETQRVVRASSQRLGRPLQGVAYEVVRALF